MQKQRIVIKVGSSSLTNDYGEIDVIKLQDHVNAIAALKEEKHEVILVSSGAVAAGFTSLGYPSRPVTLKGNKQQLQLGRVYSSNLIQNYCMNFTSPLLKFY